jgi:hypothetical protein
LSDIARVVGPGGARSIAAEDIFVPAAFLDPQSPKSGANLFRTLVESAGFRFIRTWGRWYNYSVAFQKPEA